MLVIKSIFCVKSYVPYGNGVPISYLGLLPTYVDFTNITC